MDQGSVAASTLLWSFLPSAIWTVKIMTFFRQLLKRTNLFGHAFQPELQDEPLTC